MNKCRKCQRTEFETIFKRNDICDECNKAYMKEYRKKNRDKLREQVQTWKNTNREHYRTKTRERYATPEGKRLHFARVERTPRSWLDHGLSALRCHAAKPGRHDPKSGPQHDFNISLDYVCDLWEKQGGKCAITGIDMTYRYHDPKAASIDRIDSSLGHIEGNIQLICQGVNRMKNTHPNEMIIDFFETYFKVRQQGRLHWPKFTDISPMEFWDDQGMFIPYNNCGPGDHLITGVVAVDGDGMLIPCDKPGPEAWFEVLVIRADRYAITDGEKYYWTTRRHMQGSAAPIRVDPDIEHRMSTSEKDLIVKNIEEFCKLREGE